MDKEELVRRQLTDSGEKLIAALRGKNIEVTDAFWLHSPEDGRWRIILATPTAAREGPLFVYRAIQEVIHHLSLPIGLSGVGIIAPQDPTVEYVQRTYPPSHDLPTEWKVSPSSSVSSVSSALTSDLVVDTIIVYPPLGHSKPSTDSH